MLTHNPIFEIIREILLEANTCLSEYELIKQVKELTPHCLLLRQLDDPLALFQNHFFVMNALYQLQEFFYSEDYSLTVSPLQIELQEITTQADRELSAEAENQKLREYYLNWDNLSQTSSADVDKLLSSFWLTYVSTDQRIEALQHLGLPADADWATIKQQYRRLVARYHPDKGGNHQDFTRIRRAYEILQQSQA